MGIPKYLEKKIKSIVHCCGVADVPSALKPTVKTNEQFGTKLVYQSYYSVDLTGTSPETITSTVDTLLGATLVVKLNTGEQYVLNGGTTVLAICDATLQVDATGNIIVDWGTTHVAGDTLEIYVKYTLQ